MEQADNKNKSETWEDNKNYGDTQDNSNNGELQDKNNDAELKDNNKDGTRQEIKTNELILADSNNDGLTHEDNKNGGVTHEDNKNGGVTHEDNKNGGVTHEDNKNGGETQESKSGGEKPDGKKGVAQQLGFEKETQRQEDNEKSIGHQEDFENEKQKKEDNKKDVGQQEGFQTETQKQEDKQQDAKASNKLESSEKGTSMLLKPKRKLVKKSQAIKLKIRKKKAQVIARKDGEDSAKDGEESKQEQNNDERPLEDLQAESNKVKDTRKRTIENEPPFKIMDTAEQTKQKKRPRIGKDKIGVDCAKKMNSGEGSQQLIKSDDQPPRKDHLAEMTGGEDMQKRTAGGEPCLKKSDPPYLKDKGKAIRWEKGQKKHRFRGKHRKSREVVEDHKDKARNDERGKSLKNEMRKNRHDDKGKSQTNDTKKEKLGGLIFMCSGKTKPDCFRYQVMGVSQSKKDIVMGVRPGIKLFLFDFDLKLLYGIYNASSCGGVKLEPRAFGGAFPFQVKFTVDKDCFPLPESIFKKAIKDNYDEKNKFKTELSIRQVRKLRELFRPIGLRSLQPAHSPPRKTARDNDLRYSTWGARVNSRKDQPGRDHYGNADLKSYSMLSQDREQRLSYRESTLVQREEIPRDLFLTEKEYRAYGLRGERRNVTPPPLAKPTLEIYSRDYGRDNHLNRRESIYTESVPARLETRHAGAFYLNDKDYGTHGHMSPAPPDVPPLHLNENYHAYSHGASDYTDNPYHSYGTLSVDPSLHHPRRVGVGSPSYERRMIGADVFARRETVEERLYSRDKSGRRENVSESLYSPNDSRREGVPDSLYSIDSLRSGAIEDRLYSRYAADTLTDLNHTALSYRTPHEAASLPVSSRYSFAGPSYTYR